jgi:hypothetical protein
MATGQINEISVPFIGWPVPGAQFDLQRRYFTAYAYDPYFIPRSPTGGADTLLRVIDFQSGDFQFFNNAPINCSPQPMTPTSSRLKGFRDTGQQLRLANIAGTARPGRALWKKQYWEIEIVQLPRETPRDSAFVIDKGYNGTPDGAFCWYKTSDNTLNPYPFQTYIGDAIDPLRALGPGFPAERLPMGPVAGKIRIESPTWIYEIVGTAFDADGNYRESATRTYRWPAQLNTFLNPVIGLWPRCAQFGPHSVIGLDEQSALYRSIGVVRTSTMQGSLRVVTVDQSRLYGGGEDGDVTSSSGLTSCPEAGTVIPHLYGDLFNGPDIAGLADREEFGRLMVKDTAANRGEMANLGDGGVTLPFGSGPGRHGLVFKGRADLLRSIKSPGGDAVNDGGPYAGRSGIWTGVDLGDFGEGDVIMIATDTDSRKVWFGKNGAWQGNPASGEGWACFMDGPAGARNYYPGVSFRVGPSKLRAHFRTDDMIYTIPKGFKSYAAHY